jgi:hypothetical protein
VDGDGWPSIDRRYWLDHVIEPDYDGLLRDSKIDGCYTPGHGNYRKIRVDQEAVINEWREPPPQEEHQATRRTIAQEEKAKRLICEIMRQSPERPTKSKKKVQSEIERQIPGFKGRPFDRAWCAAIKEARAPLWSRPGPRPQTESPQ